MGVRDIRAGVHGHLAPYALIERAHEPAHKPVYEPVYEPEAAPGLSN